jgi:hypothetical protein
MKKQKINSGNLESPNKTMLPCDEKVEQNTINQQNKVNNEKKIESINKQNKMEKDKKSEKPNSTITRKNEGVLIDEYGVKYTADKTKLISAPNNLKEYKIPNSVTSIGNYAFGECESLKNIEIPNSVTSIGYFAFCGCYSLKNIEIPNSITSIGYFAFSWCRSLKSIEIPNSVTSIGYYAFYGCGKLKSIIVCSDNPYLVKKDGEWLLNLPNGAGIEDLEINIKE